MSAPDARITGHGTCRPHPVEELSEGLYQATSDELPGLVAQGRTVSETLDIARDVARKLMEVRRERGGEPSLPPASARHDHTIVVAA